MAISTVGATASMAQNRSEFQGFDPVEFPSDDNENPQEYLENQDEEAVGSVLVENHRRLKGHNKFKRSKIKMKKMMGSVSYREIVNLPWIRFARENGLDLA
ncbi:hypothetical protein Fot_30669 [Forsythia ovata]|uniref:Uncharacterized protein n=1 Tax=Forsythia ovata TaxID=205694 RepID=A0ABD1T2U5_9LAMI